MTVARILRNKVAAVITARQNECLPELAAKMARHDIGAIVVAAPDGGVAGVVFERSVVRALGEDGADATAKTAADIMTCDPHTCTPDTSEGEALTLMALGRVPLLPVVSAGKIAGIVSLGDVVRLRLEKISELMSEIEREAEATRFTANLKRARASQGWSVAAAG